jgi:alcohol dehydrogenase (NADP+)
MAVKFGVAMGAHVTVISTSESKREDALKLGAKAFIVSKDEQQLKNAKSSLDFIIDTVSAPHDVAAMINLLDFEGTICMYVCGSISVVTDRSLLCLGLVHHRNRWRSARWL